MELFLFSKFAISWLFVITGILSKCNVYFS